MPLYEYRCRECGTIFEHLVSFSESDRVFACPRCDSRETEKQVSTVASFGASDGFSSGSSCAPRGGFT
jgi:putative FmdB family regulatory protein